MPNNAPATLFIVGLGPGCAQMLTPQAAAVLAKSSYIVGYTLYLELTPTELKTGKKLIATGMRQERQRCEAAIDCALAGETTAIVCSGDPGIYAMASLTLELLEGRKLLNILPLAIIPGVPALCAAAACLGAPIGHDFACISLSDLLTPWQIIEKRLIAALAADFVCVIYNPRSHGRPDHLGAAINIARQYRDLTCPVGLVRNAGREGQKTTLTTLQEFDPCLVDMLSLIVIGNCETRLVGSYMLTPRGYTPHK